MSDGSGTFHFSPRPHRAAEIPWEEWGDEAFARARREDRPVLLAISGSWCEWCHRMDETTYSDERVIELLRSRFVAIRVDTDARPDINARYNVGGWPATLFLTDDGEIIAAAAYLDPEQMLEALRGIQQAWLGDREAMSGEIEAARATRAAERAAAAARRVPGALTPLVLDVALDILDERYDEEHGGFRGSVAAGEADAIGDDRAGARFPHADALRLWRYAHHRRETPHVLARAAYTLDRMIAGDLFDHVEGGFYRYATQPDWSHPRTEKLASDQGALLLAIAEVAASDADFLERAREPVALTADWIAARLANAQGGIASAQDADEAYAALDLEARAARSRPAIDRRVIAASCAQAARGLIACGISFDRREWTERGLRAVDFLVTHMRGGEAGMYHSWDGVPEFLGLLGDQAQALLAFLHAYEVSGLEGYLNHARTIARALERRWREPGRGFWDTAEGHEDTALLAEPVMPLADNVAVAEGLLWLGRLTHDERHLAAALETLNAFATGLDQRGLAIADFARVVDRLLSAEPEFKIVSEWEAGEPDRVADPLLREALRMPLAARTVQRLSLPRDELLMRQLRLPLDRTRVAYVCVGSQCSAPVTQPEQLRSAVEMAVSAPAW